VILETLTLRNEQDFGVFDTTVPRKRVRLEEEEATRKQGILLN
jgi:hypothetical protein